jgi:hypothetical protein
MTPEKPEGREQKADGKEHGADFGAAGGIQPGRYYGHGLPYVPI